MPALLGEKGKPKIKPSRLEPEKKARQQKKNLEDHASEENQEKKKRPGSEKRDKTASLTIHETKIIQPTEEIPPDSQFKGNPRLHSSRALLSEPTILAIG